MGFLNSVREEMQGVGIQNFILLALDYRYGNALSSCLDFLAIIVYELDM